MESFHCHSPWLGLWKGVEADSECEGFCFVVLTRLYVLRCARVLQRLGPTTGALWDDALLSSVEDAPRFQCAPQVEGDAGVDLGALIGIGDRGVRECEVGHEHRLHALVEGDRVRDGESGIQRDQGEAVAVGPRREGLELEDDILVGHAGVWLDEEDERPGLEVLERLVPGGPPQRGDRDAGRHGVAQSRAIESAPLLHQEELEARDGGLGGDEEDAGAVGPLHGDFKHGREPAKSPRRKKPCSRRGKARDKEEKNPLRTCYPL